MGEILFVLAASRRLTAGVTIMGWTTGELSSSHQCPDVGFALPNSIPLRLTDLIDTFFR